MEMKKAGFYTKGRCKAKAIVSKKTLSFLGGVNTETGVIIDENSDLYGESLEGKVLVYPFGKGSTGDCMRLWRCIFNGKGPVAILNTTPDPIQVEGALLADIPVLFGFDEDPIKFLKTGDMLEIEDGQVRVIE